MAAGIATPGVAVADIIASDAVNLASSVSAELPLITLQSRSTIYAKLRRNPKRPSDYDPSFPKPVAVGAKAVGWIEAEI